VTVGLPWDTKNLDGERWLNELTKIQKRVDRRAVKRFGKTITQREDEFIGEWGEIPEQEILDILKGKVKITRREISYMAEEAYKKVYKKLLSFDAMVDEKTWLQRIEKTGVRSLVILAKYLLFVKTYYDWYNKQPESKLGDPKQETTPSFSTLGYRKPGVLIEIATCGNETKEYLIGHINQHGGVCDDCVLFDDSTIVKRYKVIWSEDKG
jgi:hypothetical protein